MSDREKEILEAIKEKLGGNTSEIIRGLIREKYVKMFPEYTQAKKEKTPRQKFFDSLELQEPKKLCEFLGGEIVIDEGIEKCFKGKVTPYGRSGTYLDLKKSVLVPEIKARFNAGEIDIPEEFLK